MEFHRIVLLLMLAACVVGLKTGPPKSACLSGQPMHMNQPLMAQTKRMEIFPPYTRSVLFSVDTSVSTYVPGGLVTVTLRARNTGGYFEGFALRAVRASMMYTSMSTGPLLGSFVCENAMNMSLRYLSVYSPTNETNCVTHRMEADYPQIVCNWTAPATNEGPVRFLATAVEGFNKYQYVASADLNCSAGMPTASLGSGVMTSLPSASGCGDTKTCALYPVMCDTRGGCTHGVTMMLQPSGNVLVEMFGSTVDWLGLGIADATEMENTELFVCTWDMISKMVTLDTAYSPSKSVNPVYRPMVTNRKGMILYNQSSATVPPQPSVIACSFEMNPTEVFSMYAFNMATRVDSEMRMQTNLTAGKFIVLAQGQSIGGGSKMTAQHNVKPLMSPVKFMIRSPQKMYFKGLSLTVQVHGTLMTIFWLLLAGIAIIVARHSRPVFNQQLVLKKDLWFILHIACVLLGFVLGVAGVTVMLVQHGWEDGSQTHGIIGLIGMSLALLNILAGLFRPEPNSKFRWIFNRLHRYNGLLAFVFATVAIWLGSTFMEHRPQFRLWAIVVMAIWTGLQLIFMVGFEVVRVRNVKSEEFNRMIENKYKLQTQQEQQQQQQQQQPEEEKLKGKRLVHVGAGWLYLYIGVFLAVGAAFWAGLWLY